MSYLEIEPFIIHLVISINYGGTYIGETECLCERLNNTKSSIRYLNASSLPYEQQIRFRNLK